MKKLLAILLVLSLSLTACLALAEALNEAEYVTFNGSALKMWIAPGLTRIELDEEELGYGYIDCFEDENEERYIDVFCNADLTGTLEEYLAEVQSDEYFQNVAMIMVGDLPCLTYLTDEDEYTTITAVFTTDDGHYVEICFTGFDEETTNKMIQSVRPADAVNP